MTKINDDEFDQTLVRAMRARPEPGPIAGLAQRAMSRARAVAETPGTEVWRFLVQQRRAARFASCAAVLLIGLVLWLGARRWTELSKSFLSDSQATDATVASSDQASASDSSSTTTSTSSIFSSLGIATLGGCVLAAALVFMALDSAFAGGNAKNAARNVYWAAG